MPHTYHRLRLAILLACLFTVYANAQNPGYKRWRYTSKGKEVAFTARFVGLSGESAVFENRKNKKAEILLSKLTRESLEDIVILTAPVVDDDDVSTAGETKPSSTPKVRWLRELSTDFEKSVREIEIYRSKLYSGSEKWTETKRSAMKSQFYRELKSYKHEFDIPCQIVSIERAVNGYDVKLKPDGLSESTLSNCTKGNGRGYGKSISRVDLDVGTQVKVKCRVGIVLSSSRESNPLKVLNDGITKGERTYLLYFTGLHIE